MALLYNPPPPLFDLKIVYSYVIEVANSEYDFVLSDRGLNLEILVFYHLQENTLCRPGRHAYVHLAQKFM